MTSLEGIRLPASQPPEADKITEQFAYPIRVLALQALNDRTRADQVVEATLRAFEHDHRRDTTDPSTTLFLLARQFTLNAATIDHRAGRRRATAVSVNAARRRWETAVASTRVPKPQRLSPPPRALAEAPRVDKPARQVSTVRQPSPQSSNFFSEVGPGLWLAVVGAAAAQLLHNVLGGVSALVLAVSIGAALRNLGLVTDAAGPGLVLAAKRLLRLGVVLLGLRLSVGDVFALGGPALLLVALTVASTFFGTQWLGARLGLSPDLSLLVATGYSICGVSAIAAVKGSTDADEDETAVAIGLVTLAGSLAIFVIPGISAIIGLSDVAGGAWAGASIHDVAQVVAAGSVGGAAALSTAVVVKLTRVLLLVPVVAGVNIRHRRSNLQGSTRSDKLAPSPPILPLFVVGFLAMMLLRTIGIVPAQAIVATKAVETTIFTVALVGLGAGVRFDRIRRLGFKPLILGAIAWVLVAATSLVAVLLVY